MNEFESYPDLDKDSLEEIKAIVGDKFSTITDYYLEDTPKHITQIEEGLNESDHDKILRSAHTIKSSSRQLGLMKVGALCGAIEKAASSQSEIEEIRSIAQYLKNAFDNGTTELKKIM